VLRKGRQSRQPAAVQVRVARFGCWCYTVTTPSRQTRSDNRHQIVSDAMPTERDAMLAPTYVCETATSRRSARRDREILQKVGIATVSDSAQHLGV
jgi:hypothetical protein